MTFVILLFLKIEIIFRKHYYVYRKYTINRKCYNTLENDLVWYVVINQISSGIFLLMMCSFLFELILSIICKYKFENHLESGHRLINCSIFSRCDDRIAFIDHVVMHIILDVFWVAYVQ